MSPRQLDVGTYYYIDTADVFGDALLIAALAASLYCSKFLINRCANFSACMSYAILSCHVLRGFRTSAGTFGQACGINTPKVGCVWYV